MEVCNDRLRQPTSDPRPSVERALGSVLRSQGGVFTRRQAAQAGASERVIRRRVATGRWERLTRDVFRIAGAPSSWRQQIIAARLAWGDGAVVSHRSRAAILGLANFGPGIVELTVPRGRKRAAAGGALVHRCELPRIDVEIIDGIPMTTPARTLIDLAAVVDPGMLEEALDDALRREMVSLRRIAWRLEAIGGRGRPGTAAMRALLEDRARLAIVPESVFESRLLAVLRSSGLPLPTPQYVVRTAARVIARVDFAYVHERVAVEAEGFRWHGRRARWEADLARRNDLTALGWRVVHVTWSDLHAAPHRVVARIEQLLARPSLTPT